MSLGRLMFGLGYPLWYQRPLPLHGRPFKPFAGLGIGYEMANFSASAGGAEVKGSYKGLEFLNIQLGGDYAVTPNISVGPFISFSLGQYSSASVTIAGTESSADIKEKAMHQWLFLGLGGTYNL